MQQKKWIRTLAVSLLIWLIMAWSDYYQVSRFALPDFCIQMETADDGGSGTYVGLGYSFDIEGNFMPEDEFPGVTQYTYRIFGLKVKTGIRD